MSRNKFILFVLVVGGFGAFMYQAGRDGLFSWEWRGEEPPKIQKTSVRKPTVTKPAHLTARNNDLSGAGAAPAPFTFFETLEDPALSSYVDLNGKVVRNTPSPNSRRVAPSSPVRESTGSAAKPNPPIPVKSRDAASALKPPPSVVIPNSGSPASGEKSETEKTTKDGDFWVQVSSFRQAGRAEALERKLKSKGYQAFVVPREVPGKGLWHRVYLGRFGGRKLAETAAGRARLQEHLNPVIVQSTLSSK